MNHLVTCCLHSVSIQKSFEFNSLVWHKLTCDANYFAKSYICPGSLDIHTQVCENIFGNFSIVTLCRLYILIFLQTSNVRCTLFHSRSSYEHFSTIYDNFFTNHIDIFYKNEVQTVILRCSARQNLKAYVLYLQRF